MPRCFLFIALLGCLDALVLILWPAAGLHHYLKNLHSLPIRSRQISVSRGAWPLQVPYSATLLCSTAVLLRNTASATASITATAARVRSIKHGRKCTRLAGYLRWSKPRSMIHGYVCHPHLGTVEKFALLCTCPAAQRSQTFRPVCNQEG